MRIMLDTNILVSLFLFPNKRMNAMMQYIFWEHDLVLSSFVIEELKGVVQSKFPDKMRVVLRFLRKINYELVKTPVSIPKGLFAIRDEMDYPVVYTALLGKVDILITGDKDFQSLKLQNLLIMTPTEFIEKYII